MNTTRMSLLTVAIATCNHQAIEELLQKGADVDDVTIAGTRGALYCLLATAKPDSEDETIAAAKALIRYGAGESVKPHQIIQFATKRKFVKLVEFLESLFTPPKSLGEQIHSAIRAKDSNLVKKLMRREFVDHPMSGIITPLRFAVGEGDMPTIKVLLEAGASPTLSHGIFDSPLEYAQKHSSELVALLESYDV